MVKLAEANEPVPSVRKSPSTFKEPVVVALPLTVKLSKSVVVA